MNAIGIIGDGRRVDETIKKLLAERLAGFSSFVEEGRSSRPPIHVRGGAS